MNFIYFPEPENNWLYIFESQAVSIMPIDVQILDFKEICFYFYQN